MSSYTDSSTNTGNAGATSTNRTANTAERHIDRRISSETKPSFKTSELVAYVAAVIGVLVASAMVDVSDFGAQEAWFFVTLLTIGYMVSRGLAKAGARNFYDENDDNR